MGLKKIIYSNSLQSKLMLMVLGAFLPILIFLVLHNNYTIKQVRFQTYNANKNTITLYMDELDSNLASIEKQLTGLSVYEADFKVLESLKNDREVHFAKQDILSALSELILINNMIDAAFLYSPINDIYIDEVDSSDGYEQNERIREYIKGKLNTGEADIYKWFYAEIGGNNYFIRIFKIDETYIGTWINMETLLEPFLSPELVKLEHVVFADLEGNGISNIPTQFTEKFEIEDNVESIYVSADNQRYIILGADSEKGDFALLAFIDESDILGALIRFRILFIVLMVLVLVMSVAMLSLQRITVLTPVRNLVKAMESVQSGNWDLVLDETHDSSEFRIMNKTYNKMISEIKQLKINIYEEKLMKQHAELQFFQLQIRPHFLINALNIIYNLAQVGKYSLIQKMALYLVRHFQYTIKSNASLVAIKDELFYTRNYISIQELRFPDSLESKFDVDETLLGYTVPPLSIQTFVENTIKYAISVEEPVQLIISVKTYELNSDKIIVSIEDSGPGFSENVLEALEKGDKIKDEKGEHIGIYNVRHRLSLLFGDEASLVFYNGETGGAKVEIILPKIEDTEGMNNDKPAFS